MRLFVASTLRVGRTAVWKALLHHFSASRTPISVWVLIIAPLLSSCGSTTETATAPSQVRCEVQARAESQSFTSEGGSGMMRVTANRECGWSAQSEASWLTLAPPASGQGDGTLQFTVAPNSLASVRVGGIRVAEHRLEVSQEARPCGFRLSSTRESVDAAGGDRALQVTTTSAQCRWTARSGNPWITILSGAEGDDSGVLRFRVEPLNGPPRTGTLTVAGQIVQVQQGGACSYGVDVEALSFGAAGGTGAVGVSAPVGCSWTAQSGVAWIALTAGATGSGPGIVALQVAATDGPARTGTVTVAGRAVTVTQSPGCSYSLATEALSFGAGGGPGQVTVSAPAGCSWSAQSAVPWVSVTAGEAGSGPGVVALQVAATDGPARSGTVTIAGRAVTITQSPGCSVTVDPLTYAAPAATSASAIAVRAASGCGWTASTSADWIVITAGQSGSGTGNVTVTVAANAGPARGGEIRIGGQTIAVNQASGCAIDVSPSRVSVGAAAGTTSIQVSAGAGCPWAAASDAPWIALGVSSSGSGNGQVPVSIAANSGPARQGTLAVGGRTVAIEQASGCTYAVTPPSQDVAPGGGTAAASIATGSGCPWSASSSAPWIAVGAPSGTGAAQVPLIVAPNNGPARSATVTLSSTVLTINQGSPCEWVFAPPDHVFSASGGNGNILVIVTGPCTWTATSDTEWITVTSGASGSGNGLVQFVAAPNNGPARTGTLTIAGRRYLVAEAGR
jgi:hypothetical protein